MKVSVCMAAYNGGRFIAEQIDSIVNQLSYDDELIIVDDGSTDETCRIIERFSDSRIVLERHACNLGTVCSFEDALSRVSGDIVFLSDQDDVWHSDKVATTLRSFRSDLSITMIISDAIVVDRDGELLSSSYYAGRGSFSDNLLSNFLRCKYLGCTMAFRSELLQQVLPFPRSRFLLHDLWIGVVNRLSGGKTQYLNMPLIYYRRHDSNVTGSHRLSTVHRMTLRLHLVFAAVRFWLRYRFSLPR